MVHLLFTTFLLYTSVNKVHALSPKKQSTVIFVDHGIAIASPDNDVSGMNEGEGVVFFRGQGKKKVSEGRGNVFRVWKDHVSIRVRSGAVRVGDAVRPEGKIEERIFDGSTSGSRPQTLSAFGRGRVLAYGIRGAPPFFERSFNEQFLTALSDAQQRGFGLPEAAGSVIGVLDRTSGKARAEFDTSAVMELAGKYGADWAVLPVYRRGRTSDRIVVSVLNISKGTLMEGSTRKAVLMPDLLFNPRHQRVGSLLIVGAYSGINPAGEGISLDDRGDVTLMVEGGGIRISRSGARSVAPIEHREDSGVIFGSGGRTISATIERGESGRSRILLKRDGNLLYSSPEYSDLVAVTGSGNQLAILRKHRVEIIQYAPF